MDEPQKIYRARLAEALIKNLTRRRMAGSFAPTTSQAREEIVAMIPAGATVSRAGSMSLVEMGLWEALAQKAGVKVIDPFLPGLSREEVYAVRRQSLLADFMITSTNALTLDGRLVNLDATGNRVAGMCFGPEKVIVVAGLNKVAPDLDAAIARVKHHAAPINAIRAGMVSGGALRKPQAWMRIAWGCWDASSFSSAFLEGSWMPGLKLRISSSSSLPMTVSFSSSFSASL